MLLDARKLNLALKSSRSLWIIAEREGSIIATLSILLDPEHRLARIRRFIADPEWLEPEQVLKEAMPLLVGYLKEKEVEVLYAATRALTFAQQELTLKLGFKMLGIFPVARGGDPRKLSALTAFYFPPVLTERRFSDSADSSRGTSLL